MRDFNAKAIAKKIEANAKAYSSGKIDYDQFATTQRAAWAALAQGEMNVVDSPCMHRHCAVSRLLGFPR